MKKYPRNGGEYRKCSCLPLVPHRAEPRTINNSGMISSQKKLDSEPVIEQHHQINTRKKA